jgi:hypothetical protein
VPIAASLAKQTAPSRAGLDHKVKSLIVGKITYLIFERRHLLISDGEN